MKGKKAKNSGELKPQCEICEPKKYDHSAKFEKFAVLILLAAFPAMALMNLFEEDMSGTVYRVIGIYVIIFLCLKLLGKREFNQFSPIELVCLILIPDLVSQGVIGENPTFINAIIALTTLLTLVSLTSILVSSISGVELFLIGKPTLLLKNGKLIKTSLYNENITADEVLIAARKQGYEKLDDIHMAVLETDGNISIIPKNK